MLPGIYRTKPNVWDSFFSTDYMPDFYDNDTFRSIPAVNIKEDGNGFTIEVAAPGLSKKDFHIDLENNVLTISSEREDKMESNEEKACRKEFSYSSFRRSFSLSDSIDTDKIKASHKDGILYLELPKREEAKVKPVRQISIS